VRNIRQLEKHFGGCVVGIARLFVEKEKGDRSFARGLQIANKLIAVIRSMVVFVMLTKESKLAIEMRTWGHSERFVNQ
jgi:hypothetical protein